jgi:Flp pilus assembly protein TadD
MSLKRLSKKHNTSHYLSGLAVSIALICVQFAPNSASAQTAETAEQNTQQIKMLYDKATTAYNKGDFQQAISDFTQVITINPNNAEAYNNRGTAYDGIKDYSSAIRDFTQAITINPNYAMAYSNRGASHSKLKDYSSAIRDFTRTIAINSNYAAAYNNRSVAYVLKGDYHSATLDARKACSLDDCEALKLLERDGLLRD